MSSEIIPADVLVISASVDTAGQLSLTTHTDHVASFEQAHGALKMVRDELDRIIREGPTKCPFRTHRGVNR